MKKKEPHNLLKNQYMLYEKKREKLKKEIDLTLVKETNKKGKNYE